MWRFKPFTQKEPAGLEGRSLDVGNLKLHVRNVIAEGGFSSVYLAIDVIHTSKQYALKHMICNDDESLQLVLKEISVMKSLKGHPNVVTLYAHAILDMGRTKEAHLVMEFCEKSLVNVLENRGSAYFEEKQALTIFRDVCDAVFAMHCQSPPVAHRDLKAENLLLGSDGLWKLCDFGSTSTNHKRFEKPEEMGIEEDNIRKFTTPAYRAPEMWDLFRRELINEKVDIWALGCLLFRICYFKNAFDGESKLQILNGNYRIPDLPKYSSLVSSLIRDMLQASPDDRPDITQVWFRVNEQLPASLQKSLPDRPPEMQSAEGPVRLSNRSAQMPQRNPPPPPSSVESFRNASQPASRGSAGQLGAFWSSQHAKESLVAEDKSKPKFDEDRKPESHPVAKKGSAVGEERMQGHSTQRNVVVKSNKPEVRASKDFEITFFQERGVGSEGTKSSKPESFSAFPNEAFNSFVAEFDTNKLSSPSNSRKEALEAEIERLKEELRQANSEKAEICCRFEKLSAICRSQRQEIQELKQSLVSRTPSPNKDGSRNQNSPGVYGAASPQEKSSPSPGGAKPWQVFAEDSNPQKQAFPKDNIQSVRTRIKQSGQAAASSFDTWGFGTESFCAAPGNSPQLPRPFGEGKSGGESNVMENKPTSQPAGWAGF